MMNDIVESSVLPEELLALAPTLYGAPAFYEDGHLFKKLILPI
jgi:hypothetical protein